MYAMAPKHDGAPWKRRTSQNAVKPKFDFGKDAC
jgi:hypothetical protein